MSGSPISRFKSWVEHKVQMLTPTGRTVVAFVVVFLFGVIIMGILLLIKGAFNSY